MYILLIVLLNAMTEDNFINNRSVEKLHRQIKKQFPDFKRASDNVSITSGGSRKKSFEINNGNSFSYMNETACNVAGSGSQSLDSWVNHAQQVWIVPFQEGFSSLLRDSLGLEPKTLIGLHEVIFNTHISSPKGIKLGSLRNLTNVPRFLNANQKIQEHLVHSWKKILLTRESFEINTSKDKDYLFTGAVKEFSPLIARMVNNSNHVHDITASYASCLLMLQFPKIFAFAPNISGSKPYFVSSEAAIKNYTENFLPQRYALRNHLMKNSDEGNFLLFLALNADFERPRGVFNKIAHGLGF